MKKADITSKVSYGSNLFNRCLIFRVLPEIYGGIAQLGEHLLCKQGVSGSIPLISTRPKGQIKRVLRIRADGTTNMGS